MKIKPISIAIIMAGLIGLTAGSAVADVIPTHGANVHLNPFTPPDPPSAIPGVTGVLVPSGGNAIRVGNDATVAPTQFWHWENEVEFLGGFGRPVFVLGAFAGFAGPGAIFYFDTHQNDLGGSVPVGGHCNVVIGEVGSVCKELINLTDVTVAWGVSVTEDSDLPPIPFDGDKNILQFTFNPNFFDPTIGGQTGGYFISKIPEPASLALLVIGLTGLVSARRRKTASNSSE